MRVLAAVASYLLGSVPSGYLLVRAAAREDIRNIGSRSTGATNVLRFKGWKFAVPVAVIDVLKGFLPAYLTLRMFEDPLFASLCAFLAVLGHCFPFSIGFKGGKGVATSFGAYAALAFRPLLASAALFFLTVAFSRRVSLGSIFASLSFPVFVLLWDGPGGVFVGSLAIGVLVVAKHGGNIRRLLDGTERRLGEKVP
jgi:glycerol-3-phosphate acyltransferase PlsY